MFVLFDRKTGATSCYEENNEGLSRMRADIRRKVTAGHTAKDLMAMRGNSLAIYIDFDIRFIEGEGV